MIEYNYTKLKGRIRELEMTQSEFAERIGIAEQTLYKRFNHQSYFTQSEIENAMKVLRLPMNKMQLYFFNKKVAKNETN